MAPGEKRKWLAKSEAIRKSLLAANFCIVSTQALADHLLHQGRQAVCIPNGFSRENLAISDHWRRQPRPDANTYRLGYASGSGTHAADFAVIAEAIAAFLERHPDWLLTIVGHLDMQPYSGLIDTSRIEHRPFVQHVNLAYELARLDINLIPLQRTTFCDAKSPLKYYEAALVDVPSIATGNPLYSQLFGANETGLLAESGDNWLSHMEFLASEANTRSALATKARKQCLSLFGPERTAAMFATVFSEYL